MIPQQEKTVAYSRDFPSPDYMPLVEMYRKVHETGISEKNLLGDEIFKGEAIYKHIPTISKIIQETASKSLLDYGCGKGQLYQKENEIKTADGRVFDNIADYWGIQCQCFDPGFLPLSNRPDNKSDVVICVEVLECCGSDDIPWIIEDIFNYANKAVFFAIECFPSVMKMPNHYDAHITIRPARWWGPIIEQVSGRFPGIKYYAVFDNRDPIPGSPGKATKRRQFLSGPPYDLTTL